MTGSWGATTLVGQCLESRVGYGGGEVRRSVPGGVSLVPRACFLLSLASWLPQTEQLAFPLPWPCAILYCLGVSQLWTGSSPTGRQNEPPPSKLVCLWAPVMRRWPTWTCGTILCGGDWEDRAEGAEEDKGQGQLLWIWLTPSREHQQEHLLQLYSILNFLSTENFLIWGGIQGA